MKTIDIKEFNTRLALTRAQRQQIFYDTNTSETKKDVAMSEINMYSMLGTQYQEMYVQEHVLNLKREIQHEIHRCR